MRTKTVCLNPKSKREFEFPSQAVIKNMVASKVIQHICGFEISDGTARRFNFILSNGDRSSQIDRGFQTKYTHMIPADAHKKIRSVIIHYDILCI